MSTDTTMPVTHHELVHILHHTAADVFEQIDSTLFWASTAYTLIVPEIFSVLDVGDLPQNSIPIASFISAASALIVGTRQLQKSVSHRPTATQIKGFMNILRGAELIAIPSTGLSALGPPGLAAAVGVAFAISLDDTIHACRRLNTNFWLQDSFAKLDHYELLIKKLTQDIQATQQNTEKQPKLIGSILSLKQSRLEKLKIKQAQLIKDVEIQIKAIFLKNDSSAYSHLNTLIENYAMKETAEAPQAWRHTLNIPALKENIASLSDAEKKYIYAAQKAIHQGCIANVQQTMTQSLIYGLTFTGAVLLCVPGLQLPAILILGAATAIYAAKATHHYLTTEAPTEEISSQQEAILYNTDKATTHYACKALPELGNSKPSVVATEHFKHVLNELKQQHLQDKLHDDSLFQQSTIHASFSP